VNVWASIGAGVAALIVVGVIAFGFGTQRHAAGDAERAYSELIAQAAPAERRFDPQQLAGLPEVAQRYFHHAIAPGTALYSAAELEMEGTFLLGDQDKFQSYRMSAREALKPPDQFIWIPRMRSGVMTITGSDALVEGEAWTRFWLLGVLPAANARSSPDLVRSAQFRAAIEGGLWLPPTLLPQNGVEWKQVGADEAEVTLRRFTPPIVLRLTLDKYGAVREAVGQRWSDVNPSKRFQLQPFGGTMSQEATFDGLTIPTRIAVGNHYGTRDYLPFFQAHITRATYR
jgi:hypothetical protein